MNKKLPAMLLVLLAVLAGGWWWWYERRPQPAPEHKVFISGNIEATEVDLAFRIQGQIEQFSLEEGDRVPKDQVVAQLNTDTLLALEGAAKAAIDGYEAQLAELRRGSRDEEIEMARASLKAAESRLANAMAEYERYLPLFQQGVISASLFDAKKMALKVARADRRNSEQRLQELRIGPRIERIRAAEAQLERARWELKKIRVDLEHTELRSPIDGVLLTKSHEQGEVVLPGATVATAAQIDEVWLKGYVGGRHLGKIKIGQRAEVTTDTYGDKVYPGRVTFIASRAEFTPKNVQTKEERVKLVYRVKVTLPNPEQELKIGMPAEGYILTNSAYLTPGGEAQSDNSATEGQAHEPPVREQVTPPK